MTLKKCLWISGVLLSLTLVGCQGRLELVVKNSTPDELVVVSDGKEYRIPSSTEVRFDSPIDRQLLLKRGDLAYRFLFPFGPRPHSLNKHIDSGTLVAQVQIMSLAKMTVLPSNEDKDTPPLRITGESVFLSSP